MNYLFALLSSFILTVGFIILSHPFACKIGLVDNPGGRKTHHGKIPLIGGLAMVIAFLFCTLFIPIALQQYRGLLAGAILLLIIGIADDFHEISPKHRLISQVIVGIIAIYFNNRITNFGNIFFINDLQLGPLSDVVTVLAFVSYINAINMIDGLDGLSGSICFTQILILLVFAAHHNAVEALVLGILLSVILAYLLFNFPRPPKKTWRYKIFMGDVGSMFLGYTIAWFCISLSQGANVLIRPVSILWIIAFPIFDLLTVMIRRTLKGKSPFKADREHLHHLIIASGYGQLMTVIIIAALSLILGIIGLALQHFHIAAGISFSAFITVFLLYFTIFCIFFKN